MAGTAPFFWREVISALSHRWRSKMTTTKQLAANGVTPKESTHSRTDGDKSRVIKLPDAARSSAPEKMRTINVYQSVTHWLSAK
jgi:hypothetical protein